MVEEHNVNFEIAVIEDVLLDLISALTHQHFLLQKELAI
jgi:hypothetical protein